MAPADVDPTTAYVPPEFIRLTAAVAANGLDAMRDRAAAGMEQVYGLDPVTGSMFEIPHDFWRSAAAPAALQRDVIHIRRSPSAPVETLVAVVFKTAIPPPISAASEDRLPIPADDPSPAIYIPPEFRRVTDAVAADGREPTHDRLARGEPALGINPITGERVLVPVDVWWSQAASRILATDIWTRTLPHHGNRRPTEDLVVVLPVRSTPPPEDNPPSPTVDPLPEDAPPAPTVDPLPDDAPPTPTVDTLPEDAPPAPIVDTPPEDVSPASIVDTPPEDAPPAPTADPSPEDAPPTPIADPAPEGVASADAEPAVPRVKKRSRRLGPQERRAKEALKEIYPDGTVPEEDQTEFVRGKVNDHLAKDNKARGLGDVSWDTMNRVLGRR